MNKQKPSRFDTKQRLAALALAGSALVASSAQAAYTLPAAATAAFADMQSAWTAVESLVWPVLMAVVIGMFVMRKTKQGANKA